MLNYNIPDRKRKRTLQHFDLVWQGTLSGGEGREEMCLYWREKSLLPSFRNWLSLSFVPDLGLPGGLTGRWKRLYRNNKPWEETMGETERWQRGRRRRRRRDLRRAHGPAHVSIRPTDQRPCSFPSPWRLRPTSLHREPNQEYVLSTQYMQFLSQGCEFFDHGLIRVDTVCRCFTLWGLLLKDELILIKTTKSFLLPPPSHSPWQVLYVFVSFCAAVRLWQ